MWRPTTRLCTACPLVLILVLWCGSVRGGTNVWTLPGEPLYGGIIRALEAGDGVLYAGTWGDGVFESQDQGALWRPICLAGQFVDAIAVSPEDDAVVYAGTVAGVFKTESGGATWTLLTHGNTLSVTIDPDTLDREYAASIEQGIVRTDDGGVRWHSVNDGIPADAVVRVLAIHPNDPGRLYAGTDVGLFVTESRGALWSELGPMRAVIRDITFHPVDPGRLYVGTWARGIYATDDRGATFIPVLPQSLRRYPYSYVSSMAVDPLDPRSIYAGTAGGGLVYSLDWGATWKIAETVNRFIMSAAADATTVYAGTEGDGVYRRRDSPLDWDPASRGITNSHVKTVAFDPMSADTIYAATWGGGVYRSEDRGVHWIPARDGLLNLILPAFTVHPTIPGRLYAGLDGRGVSRSDDHGRLWTPIRSGLTAGIFVGLEVDPSNPDTVYAGSEGKGVFRSDNGGDVWTHTGLTFGAIWSLAVNPADPNRLLAGTWGSVRFGDEKIGISLSRDGGDNWAQILESDPVVSLDIHPEDPTSVYAGTFGDGVLHSHDAGETWASIRATLPERNVWSVAVDPTRAGRVFAGTWGGGIYRTDDDGAVWRHIGHGLPSPNVYSIAVDPRNPNVLFAGTSTGVFRYLIDDLVPLATDNPGSTKLFSWGEVKARVG